LVQIAKSHKGDPSNRKSKSHQLAGAGSAELTLEGDGDVFFPTAIAQILVPYRQLGQRYIHLTSNLDMILVPQKEMLHDNGFHCNARSLLWQFLQRKSQHTFPQNA
jgi:hypothetical protein